MLNNWTENTSTVLSCYPKTLLCGISCYLHVAWSNCFPLNLLFQSFRVDSNPFHLKLIIVFLKSSRWVPLNTCIEQCTQSNNRTLHNCKLDNVLMTVSFFVRYFIPVFLGSIKKSCVQGWHCPCMNVGFLSHSAFLLWVYGEPAVKLGKGVMYLVILGFSLTMVWDWLSSLIGKFLIWFWFFFCFFFVFFQLEPVLR